MSLKASEFHPNKNWHNWYIYDIYDYYLDKYSPYFKGTLVDLGCGEAPYKRYFLQFAKVYIGVDWTNTLHNSKADIVSNLNEKIMLEESSADSIISISVLEHLCEPQIFINESYRILKEDGVMVLQVPWQWWVHEEPYDYFRYTPFGLIYMFEKAGFTDIEVEAQSGFFTMIILKINYFTARVRYIKGSRLWRWPMLAFFRIFWGIGQLLAPYLDKLDNNWDAESSGYFVVAHKKHKEDG